MGTPLKGIERVTVLDARIWPLNYRNSRNYVFVLSLGLDILSYHGECIFGATFVD